MEGRFTGGISENPTYVPPWIRRSQFPDSRLTAQNSISGLVSELEIYCQ